MVSVNCKILKYTNASGVILLCQNIVQRKNLIVEIVVREANLEILTHKDAIYTVKSLNGHIYTSESTEHKGVEDFQQPLSVSTPSQKKHIEQTVY